MAMRWKELNSVVGSIESHRKSVKALLFIFYIRVDSFLFHAEENSLLGSIGILDTPLSWGREDREYARDPGGWCVRNRQVPKKPIKNPPTLAALPVH